MTLTLQQRLETARERFQRSLQDFILTDLESGIIFASIALNANTQDKRVRMVHSARTAYDAAMHFSQKAPISTDGRSHTRIARLTELKYLLMQLGETFEE